MTLLAGSDRTYPIMVYRFGSLCLNLSSGELRNSLTASVSLFSKENSCTQAKWREMHVPVNVLVKIYLLPLCWWNTFISLIKYISIGSSFHSTTLMSFQIQVPVLCQFNGKSLVLLNISEYMLYLLIGNQFRKICQMFPISSFSINLPNILRIICISLMYLGRFGGSRKSSSVAGHWTLCQKAPLPSTPVSWT